MRVSVVATVLNEGESIRRLMDSLAAQTRQPDEIVIVDGGSRDNTADVIRGYSDRLPVQVIVEPGANISRGRNTAIRHAAGDVIAVTDAGVRLTDGWLEALVTPFRDGSNRAVVAGFFLPDWRTTFEAAMSATVLPRIDDIDPSTFLPSSRSVAFTRAAWQAVGGYPEWLDYCEDLVFDLRLRSQSGPFAFAPRALVYFRPRGTIRSFFRQYYLYARGDGKADLWRKRHAVRYLTYMLGLPAIVLAGLLIHPLAWGLLAVGGYVYCKRPFQRLRALMPDANAGELLRAALWIPVIRAVGDAAKMLGYPVGVYWRIKHRPPAWR